MAEDIKDVQRHDTKKKLAEFFLVDFLGDGLFDCGYDGNQRKQYQWTKATFALPAIRDTLFEAAKKRYPDAAPTDLTTFWSVIYKTLGCRRHTLPSLEDARSQIINRQAPVTVQNPIEIVRIRKATKTKNDNKRKKLRRLTVYAIDTPAARQLPYTSSTGLQFLPAVKTRPITNRLYRELQLQILRGVEPLPNFWEMYAFCLADMEDATRVDYARDTILGLGYGFAIVLVRGDTRQYQNKTYMGRVYDQTDPTESTWNEIHNLISDVELMVADDQSQPQCRRLPTVFQFYNCVENDVTKVAFSLI